MRKQGGGDQAHQGSAESGTVCAKEEGVAIAMISEGLGHSSEKVTHVYLSSFNNNAMSKANRKVISTIHAKKKKRKKGE